MYSLMRDFRYAARRLAKAPMFTLACVLTIAIGMASVTCVYSVIYGTVLKPYPYNDVERVFRLTLGPKVRAASVRNTWVPTCCVADWRGHCASFESIAVLATVRGFNLHVDGEPAERVLGARVTGDFFSTLGVDAEVGRTLLPEESAKGAARVVVLGNGFWKRRFGGDPAIVGKTLDFDSVPRLVVGVLKDVPLPRAWVANKTQQEPQIWVPFNDPDFYRQDPGTMWEGWDVFARLKPGVTVEQAQQELLPAVLRIGDRNDASNELKQSVRKGRVQAWAIPLLEHDTAGIEGPLLLILAIACTVLLIACANVTNLFLARSIEIHRETMIRSALGATPTSLMRLVFAESLVVSLAGGALGGLLAYAAIPLVVSVLPSFVGRLDQVHMDGAVLLVTLAVSVGTGLVCAVFPAIRLFKTDLQSILKEGGRSASAGRSHNLLRNSLVTAEVAVALVVLYFAALFSSELVRQVRVQTGFATKRVLTAQFELRDARSEADMTQFELKTQQDVSALPDVESAALSVYLPLASNGDLIYRVKGQPDFDESSGNWPSASFNAITPGYFATLGIPLIQGRDFERGDTLSSEPVMIVDQDLAHRWFKDQSALGALVEIKGAVKSPVYRIVGVVGHTKTDLYEGEGGNRGGREFCGQIYIPFEFFPSQTLYMLARTRSDDPFSALPSIRSAIAASYPQQPLHTIQTMKQVHRRAMSGIRGLAMPAIVFSLIGVTLAALGCYSVMAYRVVQRRHEIGTRMALGATPSQIILLIMKQAYVLLLAGTVVGVGATISTERVPQLNNLNLHIFQVSKLHDWCLLGATLVILSAMVFPSAFVSAYKAAQIDPVIALRED